MTISNEARREVMTLAWARFRFAARSAAPQTFAAALSGAWAWIKGAAERLAAAAAWAAAPAQIIHLRPAYSPIPRRLGGGWADHKAAYTTARLGY